MTHVMTLLLGLALLMVPVPVHADLTPEEEKEYIASLILDLKSDDTWSNATWAITTLLRLGKKAIPALEEALDSDDIQQRHFAAHVLRKTCDKNPSPRLLAVTVEGLSHDEVPDDPGSLPYVYNALEGVDFLLTHTDGAKADLVKALAAYDGQQRFLAAYIVGMSRKPWRVRHVCSLLIEHLEDNDVPNDASLACSALFRIGDAALPLLRRHLHSDDKQQRELVGLLIDDIQSPPRLQGHLKTAGYNVIYDPLQSGRLVNIPTIQRSERFRALKRLRRGDLNVAPLKALRKQHPRILVVEKSNTDGYSIVVVRPHNGWETLLTLRIHYVDESVDQLHQDDDGEGYWVQVRPGRR